MASDDKDKTPKLNAVTGDLRLLIGETLRKTPRLGTFSPTRRMFVHGWADDELIVTIQGDDFDAAPSLRIAVKLEVREVD